MSTATSTVSGSACAHCVNSVKEEAGQIAGVSTVDVDLSGRVTVTSAALLGDSQEGGRRGGPGMNRRLEMERRA